MGGKLTTQQAQKPDLVYVPTDYLMSYPCPNRYEAMSCLGLVRYNMKMDRYECSHCGHTKNVVPIDSDRRFSGDELQKMRDLWKYWDSVRKGEKK